MKWNVPFPRRPLNLIYLASLRREMHYNIQDRGKWQFNDYRTSFTFGGNWTVSTSKAKLVACWKMECRFAFLFTFLLHQWTFTSSLALFFHFHLAVTQSRPDFKCACKVVIYVGNFKWMGENHFCLYYLLMTLNISRRTKLTYSLLQVRVAWHNRYPILPTTS